MDKDKRKKIFNRLVFDIFSIQPQEDGLLEGIDVLVSRLSPVIHNLSAVRLYSNIFDIVLTLLESHQKDITAEDVINFWSGNTIYEEPELSKVQKEVMEIYHILKGGEDGHEDLFASVLLEYGFPIYEKYLIYKRYDTTGEILHHYCKRNSEKGVAKKNENYNKLKEYAQRLFNEKKAENPRYSRYKFAKNNWKKIRNYAKDNNIIWTATDKELSVRKMLKDKKS